MKSKIIAAIVAAAMSITLAACGANTPVNNSADNATSEPALKATQSETDTQVIAENETEVIFTPCWGIHIDPNIQANETYSSDAWQTITP